MLLKEMKKRYLEIVILPSIYHIKDPKFSIINSLDINPEMTLLFVATSKIIPEVRRLEEFHVASRYRAYIQRYLVVMGFMGFMYIKIDQKDILFSHLTNTENENLGLFLSTCQNFEFKHASSRDFSYPTENFVGNLVPKSENSKLTFIIFSCGHEGQYYSEKILNVIKNRFLPKMYTLWGCGTESTFYAIECELRKNQPIKTIKFECLCIAGSSFESWSTIVNCSIGKKALNKKLSQFRDQTQLERKKWCRILGFACCPKYIIDFLTEDTLTSELDVIDSVKKNFPTVSFTIVLNSPLFNQFGVDSTSDVRQLELSRKMSLSLLILAIKN